jgi:hypothetical protein
VENGEVRPGLKLDFDDLVGELDEVEEGLKTLKEKIEVFQKQATEDLSENDNEKDDADGE